MRNRQLELVHLHLEVQTESFWRYINTEKGVNTMNEQNQSGAPRKWWQWVLVYPTLVTALIGAIPTFVQLYRAWDMDVPYSKVGSALNQSALWQKNTACLGAKQIEQVTTSHLSDISLLRCSNDDLLVALPKGLHWIAAEELEIKKAEHSTMFQEAFASEGNPEHRFLAQTRMVICQRKLKDGLLLLRVRYGSNQCFDETINTYTGALIKRVQSSCETNC